MFLLYQLTTAYFLLPSQLFHYPDNLSYFDALVNLCLPMQSMHLKPTENIMKVISTKNNDIIHCMLQNKAYLTFEALFFIIIPFHKYIWPRVKYMYEKQSPQNVISLW